MGYTQEQYELLLRKGVFLYDWFDRFSKLKERKLPPKEAFFLMLYNKGISDDDYAHAEVWKKFKMRTMKDYYNLYLDSDVLLLADVFENFRDVCLQHYKLDPAWYYSAPGLSWDAMLKLTGIDLELLSDYDMLLMVEKGGGGISTITTRYAKADNKYMKKYQSSREEDYIAYLVFLSLFVIICICGLLHLWYFSLVTLCLCCLLQLLFLNHKPQIHSLKNSSYITYFDANNLYGWAMSKKLPTHGFRWMNEEEHENWRDMPCIVEVDLTYPHHLHELNNDYPLAPKRIGAIEVDKLIPNLRNKKNYVVHHEPLKQCLELGLEITKVHRGITFYESAWLKPYIDLNTELRTKATDDLEKNFFKLMYNFVFGKTIENIRNRVNIELVGSEAQARKWISEPRYEDRKIFSEHLIAIHVKKKLLMNKPVYLGMAILDFSKTLMY